MNRQNEKMMHILTWLLTALAGAALGVFFFGGLWWTVRGMVDSGRGALFMAASLLLRLGVTGYGFYLAAGGQWQGLLACLLGFLLARRAVLHLSAASARKEANHAPES